MADLRRELREPFLSKCHNYGHPFEIPGQKIPTSWKGQHTSATDIDSIAVVCDVCKQAHSYNAVHFPPLGMTDKPSPYATGGSLNLFHVPLGCENKDCAVRLEVLAPKRSHISLEEVQEEMHTWNVSFLKCRCGGQIVIPKKAKPKFYYL
jgi:hypothetical protein